MNPNSASTFRQFRQAFVIGRVDESFHGQAPYFVIVVYMSLSFINLSRPDPTPRRKRYLSGIERPLTKVSDKRSAFDDLLITAISCGGDNALEA